MRVIFAVFLCFGISGCICLNPAHRQQVAPTVSTTRVIDTLTDTKQVLAEAGESNTVVGQKIDKALTLAEKLNVLLDQIEDDQAKIDNKTIIKP